MSASPGLTHCGSVIQNGPGMPIVSRPLLTSPYVPLNRNRKRIPTATGGVMFGR
jgi:hypothetical protein